MRKVHIAVAALAEVGEGPVWDARDDTLAWVDIAAGTLHTSRLDDGYDDETTFNTLLGAIAPRGCTGWVAAVSDGFGFIDGASLTVVDCALPQPNLRMNDAKCDIRGRLWAGSTDLSSHAGLGSLHCWDGRAPSRVAVSGLTLPNGIAWSPGNDLMYMADSVVHTVFRASFDSNDGALGPFEPFIEIARGMPDGMCVSEDGSLWIAIWGDGTVQRFGPAGDVVETIKLPASQASSCAIGPDQILYVTSARGGLSTDEIGLQPHAGSVFAVEIDVDAPPATLFAG